MKLKVSLGEGGLKGLFTQHAEKVIFGVVLVLVASFVYLSATQETMEGDRTPDDLKRQATSASTHLKENYWDEIAPEREKEVDNYPQRAKVARSKIDEKGYTLPNPLDRPLIPPKTKRGDPEILPPVQVEAEGAVYAVAMRRKPSEGDPWVNDKNAVVKPKEEEKPKRRKKKKKSRAPMDEGMLYGAGMGYGGEEGEGGYLPYEMASEEEEGDMTSGMMGTSMATGGVRKLDKFYIDHYIRGYRGSASGAIGSSGVLAKSRAVVAVKALVPYEKQWEEYVRVLANATGYSPAQDIPKYLLFMAERAEVPADPDAPLQWVPISNTSYELQVAMQYGGVAKEIADAAHVLPGTVTMPIPPILLKPLDPAIHSEIPRQQMRQVQLTRTEEEETEGPADPSMDLSQGIPEMPKGRPGSTGMYGTGAGMYGGGGAMPYPGGGGYSDPGMYQDEGGGYGEGEMAGDGGYGYGGGYGMGGGYGGTGMESRQPLVKHKMVRFFDLTAEPGKSYRYRVALVLEDPNRPRNPKADPSRRILDADAKKRVEEVEAKDAADTEYVKKNGRPKRTFYRRTDWSEPSNIVTIAPPAKFVAGATTKAKPVTLPEGTKVITADASGSQVEVELEQSTEVETTESSGKLVTVVWDERRAVEVPVEKDVYRGTFLTFEQDADVLHPMSLQIKTIEQYPFDTDAFVADLRCGGVLITDTDEEEDEETKLLTPGEFLVVDGEGNLVACNEIDDTEEYRRLLFIVDTAEPVVATGGYGDMEGDMMEGYGDMMGGGYDEMMGGGYGEEYP
jgi:hypothetical protein